MNWDAMGAVAEMLGAFAVFISLIYLAIQTKQNTKALRSAAFQQVRDSFSNVSMAMAQDPKLGSLLRRVANNEELSEDEVSQTNFLLTTLIRKGESAYFQSYDGTLQRESWLAIRVTLLGGLSSSYAKSWLLESRARFTKEYIDDLIEGLGIEGSA